MEEDRPTEAKRDAPRAHTPKATFSTPDQPTPAETPAERAQRRAKAAPPVTFQPPADDGDADSGPDRRTPARGEATGRGGARAPGRRREQGETAAPEPRGEDTDAGPAGRPAQRRRQPSPAKSQPSPAKSQPSPAKSQPSPTKSQPSPAESQPSTAENQPSTAKSQPGTTKSEPGAAKKQAAKADRGPAVTAAQREEPEEVPMPTDPTEPQSSQPDATAAASDEARTTPANPRPAKAQRARKATPAKAATTPAEPENAQPKEATPEPEPPREKPATDAPVEAPQAASAPSIPTQPTPATKAPAKKAPAKRTPRKRADAQLLIGPEATPEATPEGRAPEGRAPEGRAPEATPEGTSQPAKATTEAPQQARPIEDSTPIFTELSAEKTEPDAKPSEPTAKPSEPTTQKAEATARKTKPSAEKAESSAQKLQPSANPTEPSADKAPEQRHPKAQTDAWAQLIADPGHAPELLALAAVQTIGPRAQQWARTTREAYPTATDKGLARLASRQFARFGSLSSIFGAVAGSYAPIALLGAAALTHAELILHLAAAYGLDPTDEARATDLLVLTRVHPTREDAETALRAAKQPAYEESTKLSDAAWRLGRMVAAHSGGWASIRLVNRFFPGASLLVAALASSMAAETVANRANGYFSQANHESGSRV